MPCRVIWVCSFPRRRPKWLSVPSKLQKPFLKRAAALDAEHYRLHAIRGEIARLQEHTEEAVTEYNAALAHLPQNPAEGPLYGIQLHMNLTELYQNLRRRKRRTPPSRNCANADQRAGRPRTGQAAISAPAGCDQDECRRPRWREQPTSRNRWPSMPRIPTACSSMEICC